MVAFAYHQNWVLKPELKERSHLVSVYICKVIFCIFISFPNSVKKKKKFSPTSSCQKKKKKTYCFISSNANVFCLIGSNYNLLASIQGYCFCLIAVCLQQQLAICMDSAALNETQMPFGRKMTDSAQRLAKL